MHRRQAKTNFLNRLSISPGATTAWLTVLRLISLMIFHVHGNQSSDRFLPGWNSTVLADEVAGVIIFLIAIFDRGARLRRGFTIIASRSTASTTSASPTRPRFLLAKLGCGLFVRI
jgi:hypothetical protein